MKALRSAIVALALFVAAPAAADFLDDELSKRNVMVAAVAFRLTMLGHHEQLPGRRSAMDPTAIRRTSTFSLTTSRRRMRCC